MSTEGLDSVRIVSRSALDRVEGMVKSRLEQ
jgi:hypothetical protein